MEPLPDFFQRNNPPKHHKFSRLFPLTQKSPFFYARMIKASVIRQFIIRFGAS
jgi:hypothetical protein